MNGGFLSAAMGFIGVIVGLVATDLFARRRERDTRAGIFIGHLLWFRHGIAREVPDNKVGIWNAYIARVLTYHAELGKIRRDFLGNREFLELTDALGNLHEADIFTYTGADSRDPICSRIDRLGQIIEKRGGGWK